jgi:hypothetical protein
MPTERRQIADCNLRQIIHSKLHKAGYAFYILFSMPGKEFLKYQSVTKQKKFGLKKFKFFSLSHRLVICYWKHELLLYCNIFSYSFFGRSSNIQI